MAALRHYYRSGFTYIELGDGDELWENRRFPEIRRTYAELFDLLSQLYRENRLTMIYGNHDIVKKKENFRQKNLYRYFDEHEESYKPLFENIVCYEGLKLNYLGKLKILLVHGNQGDPGNDRFWPVNRFLVRYLWRPMEAYLGFHDPSSPAKNYIKKMEIERQIAAWAKKNNGMVIAGHTHRPAFPPKISSNPPLYFNTGCAVSRGAVTAIEIEGGSISLVKWSIKTNEANIPLCGKRSNSGTKKAGGVYKLI